MRQFGLVISLYRSAGTDARRTEPLEQLDRRFPGRWPIILAVFSGLATWVATRHGPGLSPDSVTYLSTARNLAAGHGYVDLTGQANTTFAPGYPALIALGHWAGLSLITAARVVNASSFAAIVVLAWTLLRRHVRTPMLVLAATAFVAVSPAILNVAGQAWSEPLFCVSILGFILVLETALTNSRHQNWVVALAGTIAAVGFLVRYAALALVVTGVIALLAPHAGLPARGRLTRAAVFLVAFVPLPALWLVRNAGSGAPYLLGPRVAAPDSLGHLILLFLGGIRELFAPTTGTTAWAFLAVLVIAVTLAGLGIAVRSGSRRAGTADVRSIVPLAVFIIVYPAFVIVAGKLSGASVDTRTVMPIYLPLVVLAVRLIDQRELAVPPLRFSRLVPTGRSGIAIGAIFIALYASWFAQSAWSDGTRARGYAVASVVRSPLARVVMHLPSDVLVVTNSPWALYWASEHPPIVPQPGPLVPAASLVPSSRSQLLGAACEDPVYVAWYRAIGSPPASPEIGLTLQPVRTVADGALYALVAGRRCDPDASDALRAGAKGHQSPPTSTVPSTSTSPVKSTDD